MLAKLLLVACALVAPSLGSSLPYIIGGTTVYDATKYPWQGSLQFTSGSHTCGCALISSTWAVTAAHCVGRPPYQIRFGSVNRNTGGQVKSVSKIIKHPRYGSGAGSFPNDIALLQFSAVETFSTVKAITITNSDQAGNRDCWITGWGRTQTGGGGGLPTYLQQANINVYTNTACKGKWGSSINDGHVCIGDTANNRGSCNGDSGGPLVCSGELVGVTSWGVSGCSPSYYPSVYTRLTYFRTWIRDNAGV